MHLPIISPCIPVVLVILSCRSLLTHAQSCYFPDGSLASSYKACNSTNTAGSACCDLHNSVCSTEGYCFGSAGFAYRGGCTDKNWKSQNCAQDCRDVAPKTYSNIYPCTSGLYTDTFCCGDALGSSNDCCNSTHPKFPTSNAEGLSKGRFGHPFTPADQQTLSSGNGSSTPAPASNPPHAGTSLATILGTVLGVVVGLALLAGLAFLLYRERRRRIRAENLVRDTIGGKDQLPGGQRMGGHGQRVQDGGVRGAQEMPATDVKELQARQVHEVL